ncbi:hypothetical protein [Myroides sp. LoEW2-1]|uniref:hypothetical protein n=1 Tax=Myroides sp. LoEW2-1 TaxID=2683192 RepID=UPI00132B16E8|nr:hypothetical protein [Myroides sp. LoEW2-1]MVX36227.1 hypothetical protein [Myroides sp. LoEW2-1]
MNTLKIKIDYKPLNAFQNTKVLNGSNRQSYNTNTQNFQPDRRIDPYVIKVECGVNDPHNYINGLVNENLSDVVWKISRGNRLLEITQTDKEFKIGKDKEKGMLTVYKNLLDTEASTIVFTAKYLEPKSKRVVNFQESFDLLTIPVAKTPLILDTNTPVGNKLNPIENSKGLLCLAELFEETNKVPAAYYWFLDGKEITDSNGFTGSKTEKLFVPISKITKVGTNIKCEVVDCTIDLLDLIQDTINNDSQVKDATDKFNKGEITQDKYNEIYNERVSSITTETKLPVGYRPVKKPSKVWKGDYLLIKQYPEYIPIILSPDSVYPESKTVQVEMTINANFGIIKEPEKYFNVKWLKQPDGKFKYQGFNINIDINDIKILSETDKEIDYVIEELL